MIVWVHRCEHCGAPTFLGERVCPECVLIRTGAVEEVDE